MGLDDAFTGPWRLPPNRVSRFYRGGALLERFRGLVDGARDGTLPEDWVGSSTRAWTPPGVSPTDEGLSVAEAGGASARIDDLLAADPAAVAGEALVARAGPATTGVLVKLLDAGVRLPIHAHPTRAFARTHLGSFFGKAEAWIVVATRETDDPEGPVVRIGFRRDVGRDELTELIEAERTEALLDAMHVRPTQPGVVWYIPPGVPHAIGAGVFMVEIEEPSDFSIVAETRGIPIRHEDAHLGLGWDVVIDAFDRAGHDDAWLATLRHDGRRSPVDGDGWRRTPLTDVAADPFFRTERLEVRGAARPRFGGPDGFVVGVVTGGAGIVRANGHALEVAAGDTFALPAIAAAAADLELAGSPALELIACLPPDPELL